MTRNLKRFIEANIDLINASEWKELFVLAYVDNLMTSEVKELHDSLLAAGIVDSTAIRNQLLYEYIEDTIDTLKDMYIKGLSDPNDPAMHDSYAAQFLRYYLSNTFGFSEQDALAIMYQNQANLGIHMTSLQGPGQRGIVNYRIKYDI